MASYTVLCERNVMSKEIGDKDYRALAAFRLALRRFLHFSEAAAEAAGLSPQQHQALLAIRAAPKAMMLVGELADTLLIRPHSASGLVDRLEKLGLISRISPEVDRRQVSVALTPDGEAVLASLSSAHRTELRRIRPLLEELVSKL
jgi:DNA-binding MarR family transcriptional regulator